LGLRRSGAISPSREDLWPRIGPAAYTGPSRLKRSGPATRESRSIRVCLFASASNMN